MTSMRRALVVPQSVLVVGIAGPTRSGKGTLAKALRQEFAGPPVVSQDKYFKQDGETPDCIDWRTLFKELQRVLEAAGRDAKPHQKQVVILEGFLLFAREELVACCGSKLFLQLDKATCYERRKASKAVGRTGAAFDRNFEQNIWRAFEEHGSCVGMEGVAMLDATQTPDEIAAVALGVVSTAVRAPSRAAASAEAAASSLAPASFQTKSPARAEVADEETQAPGASSVAAAASIAMAAAGATAVASAPASSEDAGQWPLGRMRRALRQAQGGPAPANGFAVVVTTGAMNPIHLGHVQLLHQAKARLEQAGYGIVGAWVSPSHDGYVLPKCKALKTVGLSSAFRLETARHATALDELVAVGAWESEYPGHWPDFPVVVKALQEELAQLPVAEQLRGPSGFPQVFYACGTDHAQKCNLYSGLSLQRNCGVVVVPRKGDRPQSEKPAKRVYVAEPASGPVAALSSTKVRTALERNDFDAVSDAMSAPAARFLLQPTREEYDAHEQNGRNYSKLRVQAPP